MSTSRSKVFLIYLIVIFITLFIRVGFAFNTSLGETEADVVFTVCVQIVTFGIIPFTLYSLMVSKSALGTFKDFGFVKKVSWKNWLITLALALLTTFVATFVSVFWHTVLNLIGFNYSTSDTDYSSVGVLFLQILTVAILPAVFEETTHRGLLFAAFKGNRKNNGVFIVIITALLFALMHQNIRQTGYTFFDGIIMGLVCYYTGSIYPTIVMHFLNNFFSVMEGYAADNGGYIFAFVNRAYDFLLSNVIGLVIFVVLVIAAAIGIYFLLKLMKKLTADEREKSEIQITSDDIYSDNFVAVPALKKGFDKKTDVYLVIVTLLGAFATLFTLIWGFLR